MGLKDVCDVLELPNVGMVKERIMEDDISTTDVIDRLGRSQRLMSRVYSALNAYPTSGRYGYDVIFQRKLRGTAGALLAAPRGDGCR